MSPFSIHAASEGREGVGARVNRAFPTAQHDHLDPFVLFDDFAVGDGGVPEHRHSGFEIVTYMLEGALEHSDSTGVTKTAPAGGAMRMRTASGMRHDEYPATDDPAEGLQLWVNLPREDEDAAPDYRDVEADELPVDDRDGVRVTTVVGEGSPLDLCADVQYRVVEADAEATYQWPIQRGWSAFLYVIDGAVELPAGTVEQRSVATRPGRAADGPDEDATEPETVSITAIDDATFAVVAGRPLGESITQRGPVVL